jgi:hypothetical protein
VIVEHLPRRQPFGHHALLHDRAASVHAGQVLDRRSGTVLVPLGKLTFGLRKINRVARILPISMSVYRKKRGILSSAAALGR